MKPKKNQSIEIKIDSLVFGGSGIGQVDGYKLFVEGSAPGDTVEAQVTRAKSHYGEAKVLKILKASDMRIEPRCKHFGVCGGCKWQFLDYADQLKIKEQQVKDAMERIGGLTPELVKTILPNESPWLYRNKVELSFGVSPSGEAMLGFYPPGYHYEVFDLEECYLASPLIAELTKRVRDFVKANAIPVYNSKTHEGLLKTLTIRQGKNTGEVMVILTTSTGVFDHRQAFVDLFKDDARISSLYWNSVYQVPGQPTWIEENHLAGKAALTEKLMLENGQALEFDILPQAFFQTNTKQAERLYSTVMELAGLSGEETVFDLYCGTGTIGLFCAHKAKKVIGVEINESAVESARSNALKNGIKNIDFYLGGVEKRLETLKEKPDVLIVDPPRAGLEGETVKLCSAFGAEKIVYVSCNPSTLARDLKLFAEQGYSTQCIQPVDMFPQTYHIESVALLKRS